MDPTKTVSFRLGQFLGAMRRGVSAGCRTSSVKDLYAADKIELHYQDGAGGQEHMLGLRAELKDGVPIIVLYDESLLKAVR